MINAADDYQAIRHAAWTQHLGDDAWRLNHCFRARGMEPAGCGCYRPDGSSENCPDGWAERQAEASKKVTT